MACRKCGSDRTMKNGRCAECNKQWVDRSIKSSKLRALQIGSACSICQQPMASPCLDHNHVSGQFRGWLCHKCNRGLGHFNDSADLLNRAANYLRTNTHGPPTSPKLNP